MRKTKKASPITMESEVRKLLDWLCVNWGFCLPPAEVNCIAQSSYLEAREFAAKVLLAEGMVPENEVAFVRRHINWNN